MAKLPGIDEGMLTSSTALRDVVAAAAAAGDVNMDSDDGGAAAASTEVSLEEILTLYNQPINEEQAWAVCYQCCRTLAQKQRRKGLKSAGASAGDHLRRIEGPGDVMIWRDGTVKLHSGGGTGKRSDRAGCRDSPRSLVDKETAFSTGLSGMNHFAPSHSLTGHRMEHLSNRGHIVVALCFKPCGEFVYRRPVRLLIMHHTLPQSCRGTREK